MAWMRCASPERDRVRAGRVLAVDPTRASVEAELELQEPSVAAGTDRDLWVGSAGSLVRVDFESLEPVARFADLDPGAFGDLTVDGDDVWIRAETGVLHRIDAPSDTVAERIEPANALSAGALLAAADSLWMTASEDVLVRLRPGGK